jgi:hypothetical protein
MSNRGFSGYFIVVQLVTLAIRCKAVTICGHLRGWRRSLDLQVCSSTEQEIEYARNECLF